MSMSRKDYEAFAAAVRAERTKYQASESAAYALEMLARRMASIFAADNPRFDRERFLAACGLKP